MYHYKLVLVNGEEFDLRNKYCTYITVTSSSRNSRNQNCNILEVVAEHNNDRAFIEIEGRLSVLIPVRSILYLKRYIPSAE